ncbi:Kelch repeat-containing protein [Longirhabdus pacifica]|uniref:Kelch repeat-containing protein n=1 Tax=Longirhabdus pacifica TaxID=2305227 RepID=UPI001008B8AA|nr:kelch repeat-containing protein [Longirhabdus pacifica]
MNKIFSVFLVFAIIFTIVPVTVFAADNENTWETGTPMLTAREGHSAEVVDGKIYVIGGNEQPTVEMYDPLTDTWTTKASMTTGRSYLATAVVDGKIYAFGGRNQKGKNFLDTVEMYDPATDTWTTKSSMLSIRVAFDAEAVNGKIYAVGGLSTSGTLASVEMYDPATDTWTMKANMITGRNRLSTAVLDGKIYAIGGQASGVVNTVEMYDPTTDTWTTKSSMSAKRYLLSAATVNGKIYAIGGQTINYIVEMYDPLTDTWTTKARIPNKRHAFDTVVVGGKIYAIGGYYKGILNSVEIYTPEGYSDVPLAPLNLVATGGDAKITLNWSSVVEADNYSVYRSLTSGGSYTSVATSVYSTSYVDSPLTNGTTYYYVVTAVNDNGESAYSNEASATPQADNNINRAILTITLNSGLEKEYDLSMSQVSQFMSWYESESTLFYTFQKDYNLGSDVSRTDYVVHDMIELFEVREYVAR